MAERALRIREFCRDYKVGRTKAYEEIAAGRVKAVKCGSRTLVTVDNAEQWLANLKPISDVENMDDLDDPRR